MFAREFGAGLGVAGLITSMRGVGTITFDLPAGVATSRFGDKRAMLVGTGAIAVAGLAAGLSGNLLFLGIAIFALGGAMAAWMTSRLAYVADVVPNEHRGRAIAMVGGVNRAGVFVGPVAGGLLGKYYGLEAAFFAQAVVACVALAFIAANVRPSAAVARVDGEPRLSTRLGRTIAAQRRSFLTAGVAVVALQVLRTGRQIVIPLWGDEIGLDVAEIGLVFGLSSAIDMTLFYPVGIVMDRWGRKWTAVPAMVTLAVGLALIPLTDNFAQLAAAGLLAGVGNGLSSGLVMTLGADLSPREGAGEFLGAWRLMGDLGTAAGPVAIGFLAEAMTLAAASTMAAGVGVGGAVVMLLLVRETLTRGERAPVAGHESEPEPP